MASDEDWLNEEPSAFDRPPAPLVLPDDYRARLELVEQYWARLSVDQRRFLSALRDNRFNAIAASRTLGLTRVSRQHLRWCRQPEYSAVIKVWQANASADALDRDRLLARQDDIVETLLTPKPVLHQGIMVRDTRPGAAPEAVLEEVEAGAASRANEVLLQAAGVLKSGKDVEVNVGVAVNIGPPTLNIQVMPTPPSKVAVRDHVVVDAKFTEVPNDDEWLGA